jgi:ribonuclease HI
MLSMPILNGRIGKWILALSEFELKFESAKAIKGQIITDFITEHRDPSIDLLEITPWALFFDGSSCGKGGGIGILLMSPRGEMFEFAIPIQPIVTNNQVEYEALLRGLQYLKEAKAISVEIYGDSELVIKQLNDQYECRSDILRSYYDECREILKSFQLVILQHIPREHNEEANRLAHSASGYRENQKAFAMEICAFGSDLAEDDWRKEIVDYLENPSRKVSRKLKYKAIKFVLLDGRLFYKSLDGVLLQCLGPEEAKKMMSEVHDGLCGAHQSAYRMKWVIRHTGCFWPSMLSRTALGVPLNKLGNPHLKPTNKPKPNAPHLSTQGVAHAAVAPTAHQGGPLKDPLERAPPRSRAHASLGRAPPRSRGCAYLERALPRSRALCTRTTVPVCGHLMP